MTCNPDLQRYETSLSDMQKLLALHFGQHIQLYITLQLINFALISLCHWFSCTTTAKLDFKFCIDGLGEIHQVTYCTYKLGIVLSCFPTCTVFTTV